MLFYGLGDKNIVAMFRRGLLSLLTMGSIASALLLSGCQKLILLSPQGPIARDERDLLITVVILMLVIVVPVLILTVLIAYRYKDRAANHKAKYDPSFTHSGKLEAVWWGIPIVIIAILATVTWISTHRLDPYKPLVSPVKPITIQVVSLNWRWLFIYPDQKIAMINTLEFPAKTPINFQITSDAPMNSFMIDQLAGQIYSMAGMTTQLHLMADHSGDYQGRSVSFSGDGFANMYFTAHAVTQGQFDQWVKQVQKSPKNLDWKSYDQLAKDSLDTHVQYFNLMEQDLFNQIIAKYMGPDMSHMGNMNNMSNMSSNMAVKTSPAHPAALASPVLPAKTLPAKSLPERTGKSMRNYNAIANNPEKPSVTVQKQTAQEAHQEAQAVH